MCYYIYTQPEVDNVLPQMLPGALYKQSRIITYLCISPSPVATRSFTEAQTLTTEHCCVGKPAHRCEGLRVSTIRVEGSMLS